MVKVVRRSAWKIWGDVIFALFAREIRVGFSDKFGLSWAVVQPIMFIFVLSFLRGRLDGGETHTIPTFVFMAYGLLFIQLFLQTFNSGFTAIKKNKALFAFRQVQPISAVIASGLFELLVKIFVFIGIFVVMVFMDMEVHMNDPLNIIVNMLNLWLFSLALGLAFGMAALYVPEVNKIQSMLTRPLFFISGVFFSMQDVPQEMWWLFDWNPILHTIELSRGAAYHSYGNVGVSSNFLYLSVLSSVFISLALYQGYWKEAISR